MSIQQPAGGRRAVALHQKKMKKKKIVFSSSGGTPAMQFLFHLMDNFGNCDMERVAAQIAALCREVRILVTAVCIDTVIELKGNTALCLQYLGDTLAFAADNVAIEDDTLIIN